MKFLPHNKSELIFSLAVGVTFTLLTLFLYPRYLSQDPFILLVIAVALNAGRSGAIAGVLTGSIGLIAASYVTYHGPYGIPYLSLGLYFLATLLISYLLGQRFHIERHLWGEVKERRRIESNLRHQEENLRLALSLERSGIWEWDVESNTIHWSQEVERIHGIAPGSFSGSFDEAMKFVHVNDRSRVQDAIRHSLESRSPFEVNYRFRKSDGTIGWMEGRGTYRYNEKGRALRLVGLYTDISDEGKAAETHSRLSAIVASSADAIISESLEGRIITWNEGAERIFGYTAQEAVGSHISMLTPPERSQEPTHMLDLALKGEAVQGVETVRRHKLGHNIQVSVSISPVKNAEGEIIGVSKIARDITLQKKTFERERFLMEASELLGSSLEYEQSLQRLARLSVPQIADWCAVYVVRDDGSIKRVAMANVDEEEVRIASQFENEFPPSPKSDISLYRVINTGQAEVLSHVPESTLKQFARNEAHLENMKRLNIQSAMFAPLHAHGETFGVVLLTSTNEDNIYTKEDLPFVTELGRRAGLAIENARLYHDAQQAMARYEEELVERIRIEKELRRAKEVADESSRAKSAFLANMSHEIRTPLGAIIGFSELLATTEQSHEDRLESLEIITRNGRLLSNIINDILDLTKVESGRLELEKLAIPIVNLVEETRSTLSLLASEKGLELSLNVADGVPYEVHTDPLRLKQILINIIGNAIKFTAKGKIDVSLSLLAREGLNDLLKIEVSDTGKGISELEASKLFSHFMQADASTTRVYGGTGLGLVLSRQLARALGGDVVLQKSQPFIGSTFLISIDTGSRLQTNSSLRKRMQVAPSQESSISNRPLENVRVLVVEDAKDNQLLLSRILKHEGAVFEVAENGAVGVERALSKQFDVILMDVQMPVMDGFEAMRSLRMKGYKKPIVALTAHALREDRERCLAEGFDEHMSKPVDRIKLRETIMQFCELGRPGIDFTQYLGSRDKGTLS